jgi:hypothetical protein
MVEDGFRDLQNKAIMVMVMVALSFLRCEGVRWSEPGCVSCRGHVCPATR